jgi:hypothetical protein
MASAAGIEPINSSCNGPRQPTASPPRSRQAPAQDPHDQLRLQIRGAVAEYGRTLIAERMRRGRLAKLRAGLLLPWMRPPYGYRLDTQRPHDPALVRLEVTEVAVVAGLIPEHGVFGSPEWWQAIETRRLPVYTIEGVIGHAGLLESSGMGGEMYLEFGIANVTPKTSWNMARDQANIYLFDVGQRVKLKEVVQHGQDSERPMPIALEIWLEMRAESNAPEP